MIYYLFYVSIVLRENKLSINEGDFKMELKLGDKVGDYTYVLCDEDNEYVFSYKDYFFDSKEEVIQAIDASGDKFSWYRLSSARMHKAGLRNYLIRGGCVSVDHVYCCCKILEERELEDFIKNNKKESKMNKNTFNKIINLIIKYGKSPFALLAKIEELIQKGIKSDNWIIRKIGQAIRILCSRRGLTMLTTAIGISKAKAVINALKNLISFFKNHLSNNPILKAGIEKVELVLEVIIYYVNNSKELVKEVYLKVRDTLNDWIKIVIEFVKKITDNIRGVSAQPSDTIIDSE